MADDVIELGKDSLMNWVAVTSEVTPSATVSDSDNFQASVSTVKVVIDIVSFTPEISPPDCVLTSGSKLEELATSSERDITPLSSTVAEIATP